MKQSIRTTTALLLLLLAMGLSGCDQAKDLATQAAEKAKQDVAAEISKVVKGGDQAEKADAESSKDTDKED
jgi:outer membrane lipoprotein-sorting protein